MSKLPELEVLVDAFPTYPRSELASRLLCASSPEVLFDALLLEASSGPDHIEYGKTANALPPDVLRLKELFPSTHKDTLAASLHCNNGCLNRTIEHLLVADPLETLTKLSGLDRPELTPYMARNNKDVLRALADVICNYKKRKRVRTSRVQWSSYEDAYVLHENSTELLQLKECVWAESALQGLNYDFLQKLLVFFQGEVLHVLDTARLYIEAGSQSITYDHRLGFRDKDLPKRKLLSSSSVRLNPPLLILPRPLGAKLGEVFTAGETLPRAVTSRCNTAIRENSPVLASLKTSLINRSRLKSKIQRVVPNRQLAEQPAKSTISHCTTRLDLHGYTVAEAVSAAKDTVTAWWTEEKESRALEGHIERYGSKAQFVEPLHIITGRGIHSAGGTPKIRLSVIRLLSQDGYLFDESVGSVTVFGRKPITMLV